VGAATAPAALMGRAAAGGQRSTRRPRARKPLFGAGADAAGDGDEVPPSARGSGGLAAALGLAGAGAGGAGSSSGFALDLLDHEEADGVPAFE
jgi:hypothetical protein